MYQPRIKIINNSAWNKEELHDQWKESTIVPIHKKGENTDCIYVRGIALLPPSYKFSL
jgi:hypothetical protein